MSAIALHASEAAGLKRDLSRAWSAETSAQPADWTPLSPATGQCAVTALVVQDLFGGELMEATVCGISHYWNRLDSGEEIDLSREQFGKDFPIETAPGPRSRAYVLSFPDTAARYRLLRERLGRA